MTINSARFSRLDHVQIGHARLVDTCLARRRAQDLDTLGGEQARDLVGVGQVGQGDTLANVEQFHPYGALMACR